ncbi:hypothetical protein C8J57DRAFT_1035062, partial [Mycena rebaudengoi]
PHFRAVFAFPQPESDPSIPEVRMAESGHVLDGVLRFCYPGAEPVVRTLGQLREILEIGVQKYDIQSIVPFAKLYLSRYIDSEPLDSFALAAHHNWEGLALTAAKKCLGLPLRAPTTQGPE